MRGLIGANVDPLDAPASGEDIRVQMILDGLQHENTKELAKARIIAYGGLQYLSADNLNKVNKTRVENFNNFLTGGFPYLEMESQSSKSEIDELIDDYKKLLGQDSPLS